MTEYYGVREADCTSEQREQIYNLARASIDADFVNYHAYESDRWEFIVFKESEQIYQCSKKYLNYIKVKLITPEEAILRLFENCLEK